MEEYVKRSSLTGRKYNVFDDIITIVNPKQCAYYLKNQVDLLDVQLGEDRKTGEPILLYLFKRSETREAFDKWCKQKEEIQ